MDCLKKLTFFAAVAMAKSLSSAQAETLPLPDGVISLVTPEGAAMLCGAEANADYFPLSIHFTTQDKPAYCGPATIAMVLNALDVPRPASDRTLGLGMFDQNNIFTPAADSDNERKTRGLSASAVNWTQV